MTDPGSPAAFPPTEPRVAARQVQRVGPAGRTTVTDQLAVEAPLEIRLQWPTATGFQEKTLAVTMRAPGDDIELAAGFLVSEGIVRARADVVGIEPVGRHEADSRILVRLQRGVPVDWQRLERHFYTSSSCGVCGKTSIAAVETQATPTYLKEGPILSPSVIHGLPATLRAAQAVFEQTGGLHAAALFETDGTLLALREDVGRHNALDKLIGWAFLTGRLPLHRAVLLVSGRASFELVQKALMAGIPFLVAVGAPSSLAVDLADEFDLTLLGFAREQRFNIYTGGWRIDAAETARDPG
ncbi:MAG: formate dehydrogenase accessory sulfurtransferase FdhD [Candidatus Sericytochromatia bacterium]|nr:formate dehydrogenase accessory sulfurtransferase FdhD [Candidatus Sericytochromatia bacterium]